MNRRMTIGITLWLVAMFLIGVGLRGTKASAHALTLTRDNPSLDVASCQVKVRVRYPGPGARWLVQGGTCQGVAYADATLTLETCNGHGFDSRVIHIHPGTVTLPPWHGVIFNRVMVYRPLASWDEEDGHHSVGTWVTSGRRKVTCLRVTTTDTNLGTGLLPDGTKAYNPDFLLDSALFERGVDPVLIPRANPEEGS